MNCDLYVLPSKSRSVWEDIAASLWLNWQLCSRHAAAVGHPHSEMSLGMPQAIMIGKIKLLAIRSIDASIQTNCVVSWPVQCMSVCQICAAYFHSACISQAYNLHHQWVHYLFQYLCISLYLCCQIWDAGWWMGNETRVLQIKRFAQERAKPQQSNNLPFWLGEPVAVIQAYLSEVVLLSQLLLQFISCFFSAWVDSLKLTWILQSGDLHSRSQQPWRS